MTTEFFNNKPIDMTKRFYFQCSDEDLTALKKMTGLNYINNQIFQSVVSTLIKRIDNPTIKQDE